MEVDVRKNYNINIIAIKNGSQINPGPGGEHVFEKGSHIVVIGKSSDVLKLSAQIPEQ